MLGEDSSDITLGNWCPLMTKGSMCWANHFRLKGKAWLVGTQSWGKMSLVRCHRVPSKRGLKTSLVRRRLYTLYFVNVLQ